MKTAKIVESVVRHAGLVMAHAAVVVSVLKANELVCPFAVVCKGESRQSLEFKAATQDQPVSHAWDSLDANKAHLDLWALAREGLVSTEQVKADVLMVASWGRGMSEPVMFTQRFCGRGATFELAGPIEIWAEASAKEIDSLRSWFYQGINEHPKSSQWWAWTDAAKSSVQSDDPVAPSHRQGRG